MIFPTRSLNRTRRIAQRFASSLIGSAMPWMRPDRRWRSSSPPPLRCASGCYASKIRLPEVGLAVARASQGEADPQTFDLARGLLQVGREEATRRERAHLRYAAFWAMGATVAAGLRRHPSLDRRSFLRGSAGALALISLAPAFGYTTLARVDAGQKRDAFDDAHAVLGRLESRPGGTA